jgi:mycothiol synthase
LSLQIRHLTWADMEAIAQLHRAAEPAGPDSRAREAATLLQRWRRADNLKEECLVAEAEGRLIGYAIRSLVAGTDQCVVDGVVDPEWRRRGIGRQLVERVAKEVCRAGARTLDIRVRDDDLVAIAFCESLGFSRARVWLRMWLQPLRVLPFCFPPGYSCRSFRPHRDEAAYVEIVNETFGDHWGVGPASLERVAQMVRQPGFEPDSILFATRRRGIVGVCTARFLLRQAGRHEYTVAHIGPLGVRAAHRGRGLACALLAACLRQSRHRQIEAAELDVDESNAPAIHVYEKCGFETLFRTLWYRRELAESPCS